MALTEEVSVGVGCWQTYTRKPVFDYWRDTTGNMVEHYTDGDLVNVETPLAFAPAGHEGLAVWGPEVPKAFLE